MSSIKVLVVDDSAIMRRVIMGILNSMNIANDNIEEATDGCEAVEKAASQQYSIILMDWNMPNMLGIDAVRNIRASGNKTPILMVTTEGERTNVITAIQAGANNYLVKPFNAEDLREKFEQLVTL
ncbi:response regulator [Vampirovibrio chlorellavorus]|uniref:response regulator n=1 Tax=Vampirovibrio chlorellavorus TaxID=758823 RepID=UPI0026F37256|nr:response regulator [Vampirovibrio chlorellavorus]